MTNDYKPKLRTVLAEPHPFLRQTAKPVENPGSDEIKQLIADMALTMREEKGIGLAAIQVGVDARVIVVETKDGPVPFINPEIMERSDDYEIGEEGCLSVPGQYGMVKRSREISVKSIDEEGNEQIHDAQGLFARVIQHEIDHLNGILFIDKIEDFSREEIPQGARAL